MEDKVFTPNSGVQVPNKGLPNINDKERKRPSDKFPFSDHIA